MTLDVYMIAYIEGNWLMPLKPQKIYKSYSGAKKAFDKLDLNDKSWFIVKAKDWQKVEVKD